MLSLTSGLSVTYISPSSADLSDIDQARKEEPVLDLHCFMLEVETLVGKDNSASESGAMASAIAHGPVVSGMG